MVPNLCFPIYNFMVGLYLQYFNIKCCIQAMGQSLVLLVLSLQWMCVSCLSVSLVCLLCLLLSTCTMCAVLSVCVSCALPVYPSCSVVLFVPSDVLSQNKLFSLAGVRTWIAGSASQCVTKWVHPVLFCLSLCSCSLSLSLSSLLSPLSSSSFSHPLSLLPSHSLFTSFDIVLIIISPFCVISVCVANVE